MEILFIVSVLILGIGFLMKRLRQYKYFRISINEKNGFRFLLIWIIFGFLKRLDYSDAWGCMVMTESILEMKNIIFSLISLGFIFWAFKAQSQKIKKIICVSELIYWTFKLMIYKGGYVVGYTGGPSFQILFYDSISILGRLFIISQLLKIDQFKYIKIGITAFLILGVKVLIFATPLKIIYEQRKAYEEGKEIRKQITGNWKGNIRIIEDGKIDFEGITEIKIDSNFIFFDDIEGLESKYNLTLYSSKYGFLSEDGEYRDVSVWIDKLEKDSILMTMNNFEKKYGLKLKKE